MSISEKENVSLKTQKPISWHLLLMAEIRRSPLEVDSLSHYLQGFYTSKRWLVGNGISQPSTVIITNKVAGIPIGTNHRKFNIASPLHLKPWILKKFLLETHHVEVPVVNFGRVCMYMYIYII